ncbi:hypothetical protein HL658_11470 [Azospirillum sp. RWY-5-1]|uniref:Uncharacterized protein n=1 Tax=Azospirillum oleiclasticum TaxID=2735135 RepID=A0ABX2T7I1_9PROT|nr:hypothetical protein [Azospirillum oleiclasticum]NYZ13173.1 hypothetical protein [Azospirillum oleiclasticum]NYZ20154.1 hypothetical protein [Azospirillum oleiclasticum]
MARPAVARCAAALACCLMILGFGSVRAETTGSALSAMTGRIRQALEQRVPSIWRIEEVAVEEAGGSSWQITARLRLSRPTYAIDSRDGPVTFIRPVAGAGLEKTLHAVATGGEGAATPALELANPEVLDGVGQPPEELPGRTVVSGSDEARRLRAGLEADARRRVEEDEAARQRAEQRLAHQTALARAEAQRAEEERRAVEARTRRIEDLQRRLTSGARADRIAAFEAALGGNDESLRLLAADAALASGDPLLAALAIRDWVARRRSIPVQLFATREEPGSAAVLQAMGPLTVELEGFNRLTGDLVGRMGAPGYGVTRPSAAAGSLAGTGLTVNAFGCTLALGLTEHRTMDGLFRCQTLPALIARVTLD